MAENARDGCHPSSLPSRQRRRQDETAGENANHTRPRPFSFTKRWIRHLPFPAFPPPIVSTKSTADHTLPSHAARSRSRQRAYQSHGPPQTRRTQSLALKARHPAHQPHQGKTPERKATGNQKQKNKCTHTNKKFPVRTTIPEHRRFFKCFFFLFALPVL